MYCSRVQENEDDLLKVVCGNWGFGFGFGFVCEFFFLSLSLSGVHYLLTESSYGLLVDSW